MSHQCNGSFSVKSANDGERAVAKRIKFFCGWLKSKNLVGGGSSIGFREGYCNV